MVLLFYCQVCKLYFAYFNAAKVQHNIENYVEKLTQLWQNSPKTRYLYDFSINWIVSEEKQRIEPTKPIRRKKKKQKTPISSPIGVSDTRICHIDVMQIYAILMRM